MHIGMQGNSQGWGGNLYLKSIPRNLLEGQYLKLLNLITLKYFIEKKNFFPSFRK